jgi:NlpC/P60 family putative phage cell wall peptidase
MPVRSEIVAEARKWLGTPYHHEGRVIGHGVDCVGLILEVAKSLGINVPNQTGYSRIPEESRLTADLDTYAVRIDMSSLDVGDIVVIPFLHKLRHLAILTDRGMIHSYEPAGMVVEHVVDDRWRKMFRRAYQFPGVSNG